MLSSNDETSLDEYESRIRSRPGREHLPDDGHQRVVDQVIRVDDDLPIYFQFRSNCIRIRKLGLEWLQLRERMSRCREWRYKRRSMQTMRLTIVYDS